MEDNQYVSGMGKESKFPPELKGWNWGAFLLNWIWGIGNSTFIALLMFVPLVNIVMLFVLGAKGNEWAWKNRTWRDVEHFKTTQRKWAYSGLVLVFVVLPLFFVSISSMLKGDAYELSLSAINSNAEVGEIIGTPVSPGFFVMGSVSTSGPKGEASLQYSISGSKSNAEAYVYAYKKMEKWHLHEVVVYSEELGKRIDVVLPKR